MIVGLIAFIVWPSKPIAPDVILRTDTIHQVDTIRDSIIIPKPDADTVLVLSDPEIVEVWHEVIPDVDTSGIIRDYFSKKIIRDTLVNNEKLFFLVEDTLFLNDISSRKISYVLLEHSITTSTVMLTPPKLGVYVGATYHSFNGELFVGGAITKDRWLIGVDYGLMNKSVLVGVKYKIKL